LVRLGDTLSLVHARLNPLLRLAGVVMCMHEAGTLLSGEVLSGLDVILESRRQRGAAWADARVFHTRIRRNIKLAECPSHQVSIFQYAPRSNGALDYAALAAEIFGVVETREHHADGLTPVVAAAPADGRKLAVAGQPPDDPGA